VAEIAWASGLALCPMEAATVDELYRIADRRLYESKADGERTARPESVR
jgi:hypothetical protein